MLIEQRTTDLLLVTIPVVMVVAVRVCACCVQRDSKRLARSLQAGQANRCTLTASQFRRSHDFFVGTRLTKFKLEQFIIMTRYIIQDNLC